MRGVLLSNNLIVISLGIIFSIILHFARSLQRLGIDSYDRLLANISGKTPHEKLSKNDLVYILGIVLSNACVVFVILATRYGTISYFTAMYGIGLLPMLLFTRYVMHEKTSFHNWLGIIIIIIGSLLLGIAARESTPAVMEMVNLTNLIYLLLGIIILTPILLKIAVRSKHIFIDAVISGLIAGLIACLDPILKAAGLNFSFHSSVFPTHPVGWVLFILSFVASTTSLLITQHAYSRRVNASQFIPHYNATFIAMPILIQMIILPDYLPGKLEIIGVTVIIAGIIIFSDKERRNTTKYLGNG